MIFPVSRMTNHDPHSSLFSAAIIEPKLSSNSMNCWKPILRRNSLFVKENITRFWHPSYQTESRLHFPEYKNSFLRGSHAVRVGCREFVHEKCQQINIFYREEFRPNHRMAEFESPNRRKRVLEYTFLYRENTRRPCSNTVKNHFHARG